MELKDTIDLMNSANYKERFVAEYLQLYIRCEKLNNYCGRIEAAELTGTEPPKHDCPLGLLKQQLAHMKDYLHDLEVRASIERVNLRRAILSMTAVSTEGASRKPVQPIEIATVGSSRSTENYLETYESKEMFAEQEQSLEEIKEDLKKSKKSKMEVE